MHQGKITVPKDESIHLELAAMEVAVIMECLAEGIHKKVNGVISNIHMQVTKQMNEKEENQSIGNSEK